MFPRTMYQGSSQSKRNTANMRRTAFSVTKKTQQHLTSLSAAADISDEPSSILHTQPDLKTSNIPSISKAPTPCLRN